MIDWNQSSFRLTKSPSEMQAEAENHLRRRRNFIPPTINFDFLEAGPEPVKMPEFQEDRPSHAPILPESNECPSQKK